MKTKTLFLWLLLFVTIPSFAYSYKFKSGDLYYNTTSGSTAEVTWDSDGSYRKLTSVIIPQSVTCNGTTYRVTAIDARAFANRSDRLTSVTIGNNVTSIGESAFGNCTILTSVTIGNNVTSIGDYAFSGCTNLTSVTIPDHVTTIGNYAFYKCTGLTSITISNSVIRIGDDAFSSCTGLTSVTIPDHVTTIGNWAFEDCTSLTSITIPASVTSIGWMAFNGCTSLTSVIWNAKKCEIESCTYAPFYDVRDRITSFTFGDEVESIPNCICYEMRNLTMVVISNSITRIGDNAFYNCTGLTSVTMGNNVISIGDEVFHGCTGLKSITIPTRVASIGYKAFCNCAGLTSVTIPEYVTSIGDYAFAGCTGLTSVDWNAEKCENWSRRIYAPFSGVNDITSFTFGNKVNHIPNYLCYGMKKLTSITIPNNVRSIGEFAFSNCHSLDTVIWNAEYFQGWNQYNDSPFYVENGESSITSFTFGNYVESIPSYLCYGMNKLDSITIPYGVTSIGKSVFGNCSGLTSVIWNAKNCQGWNQYNDSPFYVENGESSITSFTFGNYVESIPSYLCYGMNKLTSITIPNRVTSIGESVFGNCSGLTSVIWNAKNCQGWNQYNDSPFYVENGESSITSFAFGNNVRNIPSYLCYGMNKLDSITIPYGVTSIGSNAFSDCSKITSITIPSNVIEIGNSIVSGCRRLDTVIWNAKNCHGWSQYNDSPFYVENGESSITSFAFGNDVKNIPSYLCYGMSKLTSVTIPNNVTSIGSNAFSGCSELTKTNYTGSIADWCRVNFTDDLSNPTYWSHNLFINDVLVTDLIIPEGITKINNYAFYNCSSLTSVTIPNSVTSIGERAFDNTGLTSVIWNAKECGNWSSAVESPFTGTAESITAFTFGDKIEHIPSYLCYGMKNLTSVSLPNHVTNIGSAAFAGCTGLASITIPNNVTSIGDSVFYNCTNLTSVVWNAKNCQGWSQSNYSPFYVEKNKSNITSFTFGNGVENIPSYLCYGMNKLTSITLPNNVTSIGNSAFNGCSSLISIAIPNSVISIGDAAFSACVGLSSITIPNSVQTIGQNAFENCKYLEEVSFGTDVDEIGENAFAGDSRIYSVTCYADITPTIYESTFSGVSSNAELHVLANLVKKYKVNEYWGRFTIVPIGAENTIDGTLSVNPSETDATFTWPTNDNADTYTLTIQKGDVVFCILTFDANGVLQSMRFAAPSRYIAQHTVQAEATGNGFRFVVEGLDRATTYAYSITATATDETVLTNYSGTFTTQAPTGIEDILSTPSQPMTRKVFRNGQVYILCEDEMYNINGTKM